MRSSRIKKRIQKNAYRRRWPKKTAAYIDYLFKRIKALDDRADEVTRMPLLSSKEMFDALNEASVCFSGIQNLAALQMSFVTRQAKRVPLRNYRARDQWITTREDTPMFNRE